MRTPAPKTACSTSSASTSTGLLPATSMPPVDPSTSSSGFDSEAGSSSEGGCVGGFLNNNCGPDLPPVETCNIWANDGGNRWNATRCVPLAPDPAGPEEPCTAEGSGVSGFDDCDVASVCLVSNVDTLEGTCMPMCIGSPEAPVCADPERTCTIGGDSIPAFCRAP